MKSRIYLRIPVFALLANLMLLLYTGNLSALDANKDVLENGLTVLTVERSNLPIVRVSVGIDAGNIREPEEKAGLANLTASLLTEGTRNRTAQQISEEIEFVGGAVGSSSGDDYVTVSLSVLKKDVELGFDILADIILNPVFPDDEMKKKIKRIKGSLKAQEEDPGFVALREFKKAVFGNHPYGRLITGTAETLDRITRDDLAEFHRKFYTPERTIIAVVGDISREEAIDLIKREFSGWQQGGKIATPVKLPYKAHERKSIRINRNLTQANIILGHRGVSRDNPDYYSLSVMNYILGGGGFASRLMQNIREERGLVYDIHSFFVADKFGGRFQIGLQTKNESANTALDEIVKELERIRAEPVTEQELADAKSFLTGSFPMRIETSQRIAAFLVAVEYYGLGLDYGENYPSYINSVTREDVLRVAKEYLDPENLILVVVADQGKTVLRKEYR